MTLEYKKRDNEGIYANMALIYLSITCNNNRIQVPKLKEPEAYATLVKQ
jgi:hypothetical protein